MKLATITVLAFSISAHVSAVDLSTCAERIARQSPNDAWIVDAVPAGDHTIVIVESRAERVSYRCSAAGVQRMPDAVDLRQCFARVAAQTHHLIQFGAPVPIEGTVSIRGIVDVYQGGQWAQAAYVCTPEHGWLLTPDAEHELLDSLEAWLAGQAVAL